MKEALNELKLVSRHLFDALERVSGALSRAGEVARRDVPIETAQGKVITSRGTHARHLLLGMGKDCEGITSQLHDLFLKACGVLEREIAKDAGQKDEG